MPTSPKAARSVTAGPRFDVLAPEPGTDGQPTYFIATSYEDGVSFDLPPGRLRDAGDVRCGDRRGRLRAQGRSADRGDRHPRRRTSRGHRAGRRLPRTLFAPRRTSTASSSPSPTPMARAGSSPVPAGDYVLKVKKTDGSEIDHAGHGQGRRADGGDGELTLRARPSRSAEGEARVAHRPAGCRLDPRRDGAVRRLRARVPDRLHRGHGLRRAALCRPRSGRRPPRLYVRPPDL